MMRAVVTGAAGFVGSHLAERLARDGHSVCAVDCVSPYYDVGQKRTNLSGVAALPRCTVVEADLRHARLEELLAGCDVVYHQAGQPGVRSSWRDGFPSYVENNVLVTQRLLEASVAAGVARFVYASSSSVYGQAEAYPTSEADLPRPYSPYGVTKLAAEHLCGAYARNWGLSTVSLRYFTVYGPRQRPDMAMHRLIESAMAATPFPLYGDGAQVRDFTFVGDVVEANLLAGTATVDAGTVLNVAGGTSTTLLDVAQLVGDLVGAPVRFERRPAQAGDVRRTGGSTALAARVLGWRPRVSLEEGLARQVAWHRERSPRLAAL